MRALLGALALLLVLPMGARGDGDWNDDDLPYTMATRLVSGDVLSDANLPLRLLDPTTGAVLLETNSDPSVGAVGFGSGLQRGLQAGIPNGDFSMPPPDLARPIDTTANPLPYWTWVPASDGSQSAILVADSAAASGYTLRITGSAVTASESSLQQYVRVPASRGQQYRVLLSMYAVASISNISLRYQFYRSDGVTAIGSAVSVNGGTEAETKIDAGLVPPTAAFILLEVVPSNQIDTWTLYEVRAALLPAEASVGLGSSVSSEAVTTVEKQVIGITIPANSLVVGSVYKIWVPATLSSSAANVVTMRAKINPTSLGATTIISMNPTTTTTASSDPFIVEATIVVTATGASGSAFGHIQMVGRTTQPFVVGHRAEVDTAAVTIDTTVSNVLELTFQTSAGTTTVTARPGAYIQCVMAS